MKPKDLEEPFKVPLADQKSPLMGAQVNISLYFLHRQFILAVSFEVAKSIPSPIAGFCGCCTYSYRLEIFQFFIGYTRRHNFHYESALSVILNGSFVGSRYLLARVLPILTRRPFFTSCPMLGFNEFMLMCHPLSSRA